MKNSKSTLGQLFVLAIFCLLSTTTFSQDPGVSGSIPWTKQNYDLGDEAFSPPSFPVDVEVIGTVHHPTDLSGGPYPVLLFLHGRHSTCYSGSSSSLDWPCGGGTTSIPSFEGYDYLGEHFASLGYIVISISANSISNTDNSVADYGMAARGELCQHHLDLWNDWNTTGGGPWGGAFIGALDLTNVGTMGHSRGGEGVIMHALYNESLGSPYGIKAVLTLAPVDFNRPVLQNIPVFNIAPYCDGDVSDQQGVHFYDDARYEDLDDSTAKYNMWMLGANHNYYNTVWTPGMFPAGTADDWGFADPFQNDAFCGTSSGTDQRFDPATQRNTLQCYSSAFFRKHIGGETAYDDIMHVNDITPPPSATVTSDDVFMSYHPPAKERVDLNRQIGEGAEVTNTQGGAVSETGLVEYDICADDFAEQFCLGSPGASQEPHAKDGGVAKLGASQLELEWNTATDMYDNEVPAFMQDFSVFEGIQFRAAVNFEDGPAGMAQDFRVEIEDGSGATSDLLVSAYSTALFYPLGGTGTTTPKACLNMIKIPIADFSGVDITNITNVRFLFTETATGALLISDLTLMADGEVAYPPIAAFTANVTTTCTGVVSFTDNSTFFPTSWDWDFGDGNSSTDQNPTHTYESDGLYTVILTVNNPYGGDSYTEVSYINVDKPDAPTVTNDTICAAGTVNLTASDVSGGTLDWYDASVGGTLLTTGTTYSPSISATTSFWVEEVVQQPSMSVGPPDNVFGTGGYFTANDLRGLFFDVSTDIILESVRMYAAVAGTRTIQVLDAEGGSVILTGDFVLPAGESVVILDWAIPPGTQYFIKITGALVNCYRNSSGPSYPYSLPGIVSITGSNAGGSELDYYYFFYDWQVREADCLSERAEVIGVVDGAATVTATASDSTICEGDPVTFTGSGGGASYTWTGGAVDGVPFFPTASGTYTVTSTGPCGGSDDVSIVVNPLPTIDAGPDQEVCDGDPVVVTGVGGLTYSWTGGITDGVPFTPSVGTNTYTVTGTDVNGCSDTDDLTITVNALPTVTVSPDVTIASGETTPLTATGGGTYVWSPTTGLDDPFSATPNASPTTTTTYTVTVTDANGCENTASVTVTVDGQIGIAENDSQGLTIHPNPSSGLITLTASELSYPYTIEIFSADGKLVYSKVMNAATESHKIDLSKEAKGAYILKATNQDFAIEKKIILE